MNIEVIGNSAIVESENVSFTYEVTENPRDFFKHRGSGDSLQWENKQYFVGDWIIHPHGDMNDLPTVIKNAVQRNHIASGALNKKVNMLWGKGPKLYREVYNDNNELEYRWEEDSEIQAWLDDWDYESVLLKNCVDFNHIKGVYTKFYQSRSSRIGGRQFIAKLEHISSDKARLASKMANRFKDPTHVIVTDFAFTHIDSLLKASAYHKFDFRKPFEHKNSIFYSNMYTFCTEYYSLPELYGSLEWLRNSTAVPIIFKALSEKSINVKYHIQSPQYFWDQAKGRIEDRCSKKGIEYQDKFLAAYQKSFLKKITESLSGIENVGKFIHTSLKLEVEGTKLMEHGWKITKIDQNIKDYVEAQIKISQRADHVVTQTTGVHSSLANVGQEGKSDSGSEQFHALNNYLSTSNDIPEMIVLKAVNYAIKANFPGKKLKLGFYHLGTKKMQDITPKERNPQA